MIQAELALDRHEVDKVARLGATEDGKDLVDCQLLTRKQQEAWALFGREKACVTRQIDLGPFAVIGYDESSEAGSRLHAFHLKSRFAKSCLGSRDEPINGCSAETEKVQIPCAPIDYTPNNEGGATRQSEVLRFFQASDDACDAVLERAQHARSIDRRR